MHLNNLTTAEKRAFLGLAHEMTTADGIDHQVETEYLRFYELEAGIEPTLDHLSFEEIDWTSCFIHEASKKRLLSELYYLALADGIIDMRELDLVKAISSRLGLSPSTIDLIIQNGEKRTLLIMAMRKILERPSLDETDIASMKDIMSAFEQNESFFS